jgi:UDP-3-O-[3-hydroxymyristoyl] glucosamine N-acyltransferase
MDNHLRLSWLGDNALLRINPADDRVHVAVGSNRVRQKPAARARKLQFELALAISRHAVITPKAHVGSDIAVMPHAAKCHARVGTGTIINTGASIGCDCDTGRFSHIAPRTHSAGKVVVETGAFLATMAEPGVNYRTHDQLTEADVEYISSVAAAA